jgi:hypothetical protein
MPQELRHTAGSRERKESAVSEKHPDNKLNVVVVVSGVDQPVEVNPHQTVGHLAEKALKASGNAGQPLENWEMKTAEGMLIPFETHIADAGIGEGSKVYLTPKAGSGG